ncbi:glycoside hydrolase family 38 N-terminal domain-containing protein [Spiroplasma culicicola]|uniref:Mannosylglycerate hydrolase n=1 Tax=Spiroplasma culicicola AES-1 TaxID=1276246 RepID=W6A7G0_9MOLU|nr:glycoside hydrolase family 38 C-terminal domain-containing protein [Spiroplasma culicicola]AHI52780.1 mannosylglycerate hydrolase [Spiroplasma culicicola AES-1]
MKNKNYYIAHTHWDKEWYKTYEEFRVKFLKYFREILDTLEKDNNFTSFMFDGQSSVIEDYLQINPNEIERIKKLVKSKRLRLGPWFTLPDNYLTSGESLGRNLLIGSNIAEDFGYSQEVCYIPDSFGQCANMPQLIKSMALKGAIFWRGVDSKSTEKGYFKWKGSDSTEVIAVHLPLGYGYSKKIPEDGTHIEYINEIESMLQKKYVDNKLLFMGGSDHEPIQKKLPELLKEINLYYKENDIDSEIFISNIDDYFDDLIKDIDERTLEYVDGELRSAGDQRIHYGDASSRMDLKQLNRNIEFKLSELLEPILTIGKIYFDIKYDNNLVNYIWKLLFANQAHDSACATCTDEAHEDIKNRYNRANQIIDELILTTNKEIFSKINFKDFGKPIILYNTNVAKRLSEIVNIEIISKTSDFRILDEIGNLINFDLVEQVEIDMVQENIDYCNYLSMVSAAEDYKNENKGENFSNFSNVMYKSLIAIDSNKISGLSFKIVYINEQPSNSKIIQTIDADTTFENNFAKYLIQKNGTLKIITKDMTYDNLLYFESVGDDGDSYDYSPPLKDTKFNTLNSEPKIEVIKSNDFLKKISIKHEMLLPKSLNKDRISRSNDLIKNEYELIVTFWKKKETVDVEVNIKNNSIEHMLSLNLGINEKVLTNIAGQQFGNIKRINTLEIKKDWKESQRNIDYGLYPFQKFVSLQSEKNGLIIGTHDSSEYNIYDDQTLRIILFRSYEYMGKPNLEFRPGRPSGIFWKTPESKMLKPLNYKIKLLSFNGNKESNKAITLIKEEIRQPVNFEVIEDIFFKKAEESINIFSETLISTNESGINMSALKISEKKDKEIIFRFYNHSNADINDVNFNLDKKIKKISFSNFKEQSFKNRELSLEENKIVIPKIRKNEFLTLKLEF